MDLNLLRHLSDAALLQEAARRGLPSEGVERSALIEAIRAHAEREPAQAAPSEPPEPESATGEPIRTRTMADLLLAQGHLERAARIYDELLRVTPRDASLHAARHDAQERLDQQRLERAAQAFWRSFSGSGLTLVREGVLWRVDAAGRERAQALVGPGAIALRLVRISAQPQRGVDARSEDREVAPQGFMRLEIVPGVQIVAAIGVRGERGFASIAHARGHEKG